MAKNFLLLICIVIFLKADAEFILSYKLCTQNSYVINESFYISKAMVSTIKPTNEICTLPRKKDKQLSILKYLQKYKYKLLQCFKHKKVFVNYNDINKLDKSHSQTTLRYEPIRFTVKFNNGFGIISTFEKLKIKN